MVRYMLALLLAALATGCALTSPKPTPLVGSFDGYLAAEAASFVAGSYPAAATTIDVLSGSDPLSSAFEASLRELGFAIGTGAIQAQASASAYEDGVLLVVAVGGQRASRWYKATGSGLEPAGHFTVMGRTDHGG